MELNVGQQEIFKAEAKRVWQSACLEGVDNGYSTPEMEAAAVEIIYRSFVEFYRAGIIDRTVS